MLFGGEKYDLIYSRIIYPIGVITHYVCYFSNYAKINVDSYDSLPLEKTLTFHNAVILTKSVFNKDKNNYYCNIFLEKCFDNYHKIKIIYKFF